MKTGRSSMCVDIVSLSAECPQPFFAPGYTYVVVIAEHFLILLCR